MARRIRHALLYVQFVYATNIIMGFICVRKCSSNKLGSALVDNTELVPPLYEDPDQVVMGDVCANTTSNIAYGQVKPGKESSSVTLV